MKKFRFFVMLLGLFALLGFSKTINAQETVNVSITVMKDGTQVGDVVSTTGTLGGTITPVGLPAVADGTFMFWTVNGVVRTDLPENPTIRVTSKMVLVAHYASTGKYSVAYLDANTKLLHVDYVAGAEDLTPPSTNPERQGTSFDGWVSIADYAAAGNMTPANPGAKAYFVAKYTVTAVDTYTVTVDGTPLEGTYKLNDVVELTSTNPNFSYWKDVATGVALSYNSTFKFTIFNRNESIVSVNEGAVNQPIVSIRRFIDYKSGHDGFIGHYELDETKYELVEVGFIHDDYLTSPHLTKNINHVTNEFMMSADKNHATMPTLNNDSKMKTYMIYKDKTSGVVSTIYSSNDPEALGITNIITNKSSGDTVKVRGVVVGFHWNGSSTRTDNSHGIILKDLVNNNVLYITGLHSTYGNTVGNYTVGEHLLARGDEIEFYATYEINSSLGFNGRKELKIVSVEQAKMKVLNNNISIAWDLTSAPVIASNEDLTTLAESLDYGKIYKLSGLFGFRGSRTKVNYDSTINFVPGYVFNVESDYNHTVTWHTRVQKFSVKFDGNEYNLGANWWEIMLNVTSENYLGTTSSGHRYEEGSYIYFMLGSVNPNATTNFGYIQLAILDATWVNATRIMEP